MSRIHRLLHLATHISIFAVLVVLPCFLAGCETPFSERLSSQYGASITVVYAPTASVGDDDWETRIFIDENGDRVRVSATGEAIYDANGTVLGKGDMEPGDTYDLYVQEEDEEEGIIYAAALVLTSRGGNEAASAANLVYAEAHAAAVKLVYTPSDDEDYASNLDGSDTTIWAVLVDEKTPANGGLASVKLPVLAMYDVDGALLDISELQPGDVFVAYVTSAAETYPMDVDVCRLELVEHGGQEALDEVADETAWFDEEP